MSSHGVEISIAGCVREMVRGPHPMPFFLFFSFFYHVLYINNLLGQRLRAALAIISKNIPCVRHTAVASGYPVQ